MALVPCAQSDKGFRFSLHFFIGYMSLSLSLSLSFSRCMALFFLLRVSPTGFTAEVLMRSLGLYVFIFILYGVRSCLLLRSAARGEVLQYLTRTALSRCFVMCRITPFMCTQTFHFLHFLQLFSLRQYNTHTRLPRSIKLHHNLDRL